MPVDTGRPVPPERNAYAQRDEHGDDPHQQRVAGAGHDPTELVAAELVGAQYGADARTAQTIRDFHVGWVTWGPEQRHHRRGDHQADQDPADAMRRRRPPGGFFHAVRSDTRVEQAP